MRAVVKCPDIDKEYFIELPTSADAMVMYWNTTILTHCPHCGEEHLEGFKQLYVSSVLGSGDGTEIAEPYTGKTSKGRPKALPLSD